MLRPAIIAILLSAATAMAQGDPPPCPGVTIAGPAAMVRYGDTANISILNFPAEITSYEWKVSDGQITKGQGTAAIEYLATGIDLGRDHAKNVTVELTVKGFSAACSATAKTEFAVYVEADPYALDRYSPNISAREEMAALDNLMVTLKTQKDPTHAYIVHFAKNGTVTKRLKQQIAREQHHLFVTRKQPKTDYTILVVPNDTPKTQLWLWPTNPKTEPFPTLSIPGARIIPN